MLCDATTGQEAESEPSDKSDVSMDLSPGRSSEEPGKECEQNSEQQYYYFYGRCNILLGPPPPPSL